MALYREECEQLRDAHVGFGKKPFQLVFPSVTLGQDVSSRWLLSPYTPGSSRMTPGDRFDANASVSPSIASRLNPFVATSLLDDAVEILRRRFVAGEERADERAA